MASTSSGEGQAYDASVRANDDAGIGTATDYFYARVAEVETKHRRALAKVEKQKAHLAAAKASVAEAKAELDEAQRALDSAAEEA